METPSSLSQILTRRRAQQLASSASFDRGEAYFAAGRVRSLVVRGATLTATVSGTEDYAVSLAVEDGTLQHQCSCPVGANGEFCKHCVATALAWLDTTTGRESGKSGNTIEVVRLDDVRSFLLNQDNATLAAWLLDAAERDEQLRERLLRQAAPAAGKGVDFAAYRHSINRATDTDGFVHYRDAFAFTQGIEEAIAPLHELLKEGHAVEVIGLAEHALARASKALLEMDDSDGGMSPILGELQQLHLQACRAARPDPEELAARLFDWELDGEWDVFHNAVETYAEVLGAKGLAVYRVRAERLWQSLPALAPGQREDWSGRRFHLTHIMESLARADGDSEALVAVKAKDLSNAYRFLEIAEVYHKARKADAALDWAERGVKAFPADTDPRLCEFLADEYHRRRRHDEALALIWRQFEDRPGFDRFQVLKRHADRTRSWPAWRERALAVLRLAAPSAARPRSGMERWFRAPDRSELVRISLWEKDAEQAWQEARTGGCSSSLWLELAKAREKNHPAEAAAVYVREAERSIDQKNNRAYAEAVNLLRKSRQLWQRTGETAEWQAVLNRLRLTHKAKRNFIALAAKL